MIRVTRDLWHRIGRRGTTLLFLFLLDVLFAASLANPPAEAARTPTVRYIADVAPLWAWAALWFAVGILCLIGAFASRDKWAFVAACALKILWGSIYLAGWAINGLDRGWVAGIIWLAFAAFVYVVSGWPEAPARFRPRERP